MRKAKANIIHGYRVGFLISIAKLFGKYLIVVGLLLGVLAIAWKYLD